MSNKQGKQNRIQGDQFIICTFNLLSPAYVIESSNSLSELSSKIPEVLLAEGQRVSICSVEYWLASKNDPSDAIPQGLETLFTVEPYDLDEEHLA